MRKSPKRFYPLDFCSHRRGLAVLMVAMLKKPDEPYVPLSEDKAKELAQIRAAMTAA